MSAECSLLGRASVTRQHSSATVFRQRLMDEGGDLELDALPHWKPVQLAEKWRDEAASQSTRQQPKSSVLHRLEAARQEVGDDVVVSIQSNQ